MNETQKSSPGYDLIGDIHGHFPQLETLLRILGYRQREDADQDARPHERGGYAYQHPEGRRVVFLGDFIDRGPAIRETLQVVRAMVEGGSALAVMGNHELNAIAYHTPDGAGGFLRPHTLKNHAQHAETLEAFAGREAEWEGYLEWFATLPLFLDLGTLRVVHACWNEPAIAALGSSSHFDLNLLLSNEGEAGLRHHALETLLKGPEIPLPKGLEHDGGRKEMRVRWWSNERPLTYRNAALPLPFELPDEPLSPTDCEAVCGYPADAPPVFFGHYGYVKPPEPLAPNVACVDLGVIRGGSLCAYRWDGEQRLRAEKFIRVTPTP